MNEANRIGSTKAEIQVLERITRNIGDAPVTVVKPENLRALLERQGYMGGLRTLGQAVMLSELEEPAVAVIAEEVASESGSEAGHDEGADERQSQAAALGPWAQLLTPDAGRDHERQEPEAVAQAASLDQSPRVTQASLRRAHALQAEAAEAGDVLVKARKGTPHQRLPKATLSPEAAHAIETLLPRCRLGFAYLGGWTGSIVGNIKEAWVMDDSVGEVESVRFAFQVDEELDGTPEQIERLVGTWLVAMRSAKDALRAKLGAKLAAAQRKASGEDKPRKPLKPRKPRAKKAQPVVGEAEQAGALGAGAEGEGACQEKAGDSAASLQWSLLPESTDATCDPGNASWPENLQPQRDEGVGAATAATILHPPTPEALADDEVTLLRASPFAFIRAASSEARQRHAAEIAAAASLLHDVQVGPGQGLSSIALPMAPTVRFIGKVQALAKSIGAKLSATKLVPRGNVDGLLDASALSPVYSLARDAVLMPGGMPLCMPIPHACCAPTEPHGPADVNLPGGEVLTLRCDRWDATVRVHYAGPEGVIFSTILDALECYAGPLQLANGEDLVLRVEQAAQLLASEHRALVGMPKPKTKRGAPQIPATRLPSFDELCEQTDMVMTDLALRADLLERLADRETQLPAHGVHLVSILRKWQRVSTASSMLSTSIEQVRAWCAELASVSLPDGQLRDEADLFSSAAACQELHAISGIVTRAKSWLAIYCAHPEIAGGAVGALRMRL